jgi:hypothetical protein
MLALVDQPARVLQIATASLPHLHQLTGATCSPSCALCLVCWARGCVGAALCGSRGGALSLGGPVWWLVCPLCGLQSRRVRAPRISGPLLMR